MTEVVEVEAEEVSLLRTLINDLMETLLEIMRFAKEQRSDLILSSDASRLAQILGVTEEDAETILRVLRTYRFKRVVPTEAVWRLFLTVFYLKRFLRRAEVILKLLEPSTILFAEDIFANIKSFEHTLVRLCFYIYPCVEFETRDGMRRAKFYCWFIELNDDVLSSMEIVFKNANAVLEVLRDVQEILSPKPKLVISPHDIASIGSVPADFDVYIEGTPEADELKRTFRVNPPFVVCGGLVIPLKKFSPNILARLVVMLERRFIGVTLESADDVYQLALNLFMTLMRAVESLDRNVFEEAVRIASQLRSTLPMLVKRLARAYQNLIRTYPEFGAVYGLVMTDIDSLLKMRDPVSFALHKFWTALRIFFGVADILALADLFNLKVPDMSSAKDRVYVIGHVNCPHCKELFRKYEDKLKSYKHAEVKCVKIGESTWSYIIGGYFYTFVVRISNEERVTNSVPYMVWATKYIPLSATTDPTKYLDEIFKEYGELLEKEKKETRVSLRPATETSPSVRALPRGGGEEKPELPPKLPSREELGKLCAELVLGGWSCPKIAEFIKQKYGVTVSPQWVRKVIREVTGMKVSELKALAKKRRSSSS